MINYHFVLEIFDSELFNYLFMYFYRRSNVTDVCLVLFTRPICVSDTRVAVLSVLVVESVSMLVFV